MTPLTRRSFLAAASGAVLAVAAPRPAKASISITLDLEMSRNFPNWDDTHWDYEKGNLDDAAKKYTAECCRRVKRHGGVVHLFAVGRTMEQADVSWLKNLAQSGHPIGNHTYDHVNVLATRPQDIQYRFSRAPWLIDGQKPLDVIRDNVKLATAALKTRIGIDCAGFRTPGGFHNGLADRPDVRTVLREQGFWWVSSKYPAHAMDKPLEKPTAKVLDSIVASQKLAQPFTYPDGLVEVPMSAPSDITAFRGGRWKLDWFLDAVGLVVDHAIATRGVFDFLAHPSCLGVVDPKCQAVELICDRVKKAGDKAELTDLETIARRVRP
ncbi:MAG: polysaccharide deacetylase family protein [Gemmataceae bacterium]